MMLVSDVTKSADWLSQFISDNGLLKVCAIGFFVLLGLIFFFVPLAFRRRWVVMGSFVDFLEKTIDANTAVMSTAEDREQLKVEGRLEKIEDSVRDILNKLEGIRDDTRELKSHGGGGRSA